MLRGCAEEFLITCYTSIVEHENFQNDMLEEWWLLINNNTFYITPPTALRCEGEGREGRFFCVVMVRRPPDNRVPPPPPQIVRYNISYHQVLQRLGVFPIQGWNSLHFLYQNLWNVRTIVVSVDSLRSEIDF